MKYKKFFSVKCWIKFIEAMLTSTHKNDVKVCVFVENGDDVQIIQYAMKKYANSKERDINKLMKYAKLLHVESKVRKYIEVLL